MKKVLSFVLSVAMVICLMPAMAFAADDAAATTATATGLSQFSDADSIQNKEAVAVLVGLGIIDGMGDGTFQPAGQLTRAQASKLVSVLVKSGDKTEIPAPAADPFTDVAKSHWGAGAIKFGVDNGYINGMGDGTFHPDDQVTTAQLATMLDKLLGYSVADINYQWPENAMAKATISEILVGITKGASDTLNRDDAAQMLFNALKATDQVKNTNTGSQGSADGNTGYRDVPSNADKEYVNPSTDRDAKPSTEQLIEKYFPKATLDKNNKADKFGRTSSVWKVGKNKVTDEVVEAAEYTYTTLQTKDNVKADLDGYDLKSVEVIQNGKTVGTKDVSDFETVSDYTGNGTLVEVYTNDKGSAVDKIIVVQYEPAKVTSVNSEDNYLNISTIDGDNKKEIKKDTDADVFAKVSSAAVKDILLVAIGGSDDSVLDAYVPESVKGDITTVVDPKTKDGKITAEAEYVVAGTTYKAASANSKASVKTDDLKTALRARTDVKLYLDTYGFVKYNDKVDAEKDNYILVKGIYDQKNKYGEATNYVIGVTEAGEVVEDLKISVDTPLADTDLEKLLTYKETANGYEFKKDSDEDKSSAVNDFTGAIKSNPTTINGSYISKDVKTVTVSGKKLTELKAAVSNGTPVVKENSKVRYVVVDGEITTIFVVKDSVVSDEIIYLTGKTESTTEFTKDDGGNGTATSVEGYRADSATPENIYVQGSTAKGFYSSVKEVGTTADGSTVYEMTAYAPTADDDVQIATGTISGAASSGIITVGQSDYKIKEDLAVRDLTKNQSETGVAKITDINALVDAVKEEDVNDNIKYTISVTMAYETNASSGVKEVSQLYITDITVNE